MIAKIKGTFVERPKKKKREDEEDVPKKKKKQAAANRFVAYRRSFSCMNFTLVIFFEQGKGWPIHASLSVYGRRW